MASLTGLLLLSLISTEYTLQPILIIITGTPSGTQAFVVNFNTPNAAKHEALNNINFRRAFSMAIDRQTIIDIAFYGSGTINDFASGLGYAFKTWSDEKIHQKYKAYNTYDIEGSKALLQQSGFIDVNGDNYVETPSGQPFELIILSPNGWTDFNNTVQLAVEQLAEAGIRARARTPDFSVYNQATCLMEHMMLLLLGIFTVQTHTHIGIVPTIPPYKKVRECRVLPCTFTKILH